MRFLSIDPGISGALALMTYNGLNGGLTLPTVVELLDMPTKPRKKDGTGLAVAESVLANELTRLAPELVVLEIASGQAGRSKGQTMGSSGAFNFGMGYGVVIGCCAALPKVYVRPVDWKKRQGIPSKSAPGANDDYARTRALELFPYCAAQLKRKKDVGRAEAILIGLDYCAQLRADPGEWLGAPKGMAPKHAPKGYTFDLLEA